MTQKDFCRRHNIKLHVFHYWLRRFRERQEPTPKPSNGFVSVRLDEGGAAGGFAQIIYPNGTRLQLHRPVSADTLRSLLKL